MHFIAGIACLWRWTILLKWFLTTPVTSVKNHPSKHMICKIIFIRCLSGWKGYIIQLSQLSPKLCLSCISSSELFMQKFLFSTSILWWLTNLSQIQLYYIIKIFWTRIHADLNSELTTYSSSADLPIRYVLRSVASSTSRCPGLIHTAFQIGAKFKFQQRVF